MSLISIQKDCCIDAETFIQTAIMVITIMRCSLHGLTIYSSVSVMNLDGADLCSGDKGLVHS